MMYCAVGNELRQLYEAAEKEKIAINNSRLAHSDPSVESIAAKQRYLESFANWLGHKAFCHECKPGI